MTQPQTNISSIVLEKINLSVRHCVSKRMLDHSKLNVVEDVMADELAMQLDTYVMGMADETISIHERWPKTWLDAVKQRWFPLWAVKRWPVNFKHIDVEEKIYKVVCPHLESPDNRQCYEFMSGTIGDDSVRSMSIHERYNS